MDITAVRQQRRTSAFTNKPRKADRGGQNQTVGFYVVSDQNQRASERPNKTPVKISPDHHRITAPPVAELMFLRIFALRHMHTIEQALCAQEPHLHRADKVPRTSSSYARAACPSGRQHITFLFPPLAATLAPTCRSTSAKESRNFLSWV